MMRTNLRLTGLSLLSIGALAVGCADDTTKTDADDVAATDSITDTMDTMTTTNDEIGTTADTTDTVDTTDTTDTTTDT
ncbi:MAG: hypothetical protein KC431_13595, partial [Myxococcales bacterium]|nr:hypothetical protein [Myxococcales bacterium]